MIPAKAADPQDVTQLVRELIEDLKELRKLQRRACDEEPDPDETAQLQRSFEETLLRIQSLQGKLLRVELSPDQNARIRSAVTGPR